MRNKRFDFLYLPERFHKKHRLCEFLLYQIEDFITQDSFKELKIQRIEFDEKIEFLDEEHIFDYLIRINKTDIHNEIIANHILCAIIGDICQFLQVALFSSLQQRLTVTFSLIRKPFVYNLLIILRLYFEDNFLEKFNTKEKFDPTKLSQEDIRELLDLSEKMLFTKSIKGEDIYDFIFNSSLPDSLINLSNKALHPSTTRNKDNQTEVQNLNFVFSTSQSINSQWEYLYRRLPLLLLYLNEVIECIIFTRLKTSDDIYIERITERANFFHENNTNE